MSRIGKIARLPQNIRDQINEKLHEGVHGAWEHLPEPDVARFVPDGD